MKHHTAFTNVPMWTISVLVALLWSWCMTFKAFLRTVTWFSHTLDFLFLDLYKYLEKKTWTWSWACWSIFFWWCQIYSMILVCTCSQVPFLICCAIDNGSYTTAVSTEEQPTHNNTDFFIKLDRFWNYIMSPKMLGFNKTNADQLQCKRWVPCKTCP